MKLKLNKQKTKSLLKSKKAGEGIKVSENQLESQTDQIPNSQNSNTQSPVSTFTPDSGKIDAQKFFNFIMSATKDLMNDEIIQIKRELEDCKYLIKSLRNREIEIENEYKALGISLGQLGVVEINLLNSTKNIIKDKISVVMSNGQVKGRTDVNRYNLSPSKESMRIRVK